MLAIAGLVIWWLALTGVDLGGLGDLGLVSVLPLWAYLGFIPLAGAFALMLARPQVPAWLGTFLVVVLVLVLYASSPWLSGEPRMSPSWRHLGIIDYVSRYGAVNPALDAYHNWPGMFVLASSLANAVGLDDLRPIALWAPVWFNLLYLPALYVLLAGLTDDRRAVWLAILLFYVTNWIGQDYFAPQALGFFGYLVIAAVVVRWLAARDPAAPRAGAPPGDSSPAAPVGRTPIATSFEASPIAALLPATFRARAAEVTGRVLAREPAAAEALSPARRAGLVAVVLVTFTFVVSAHQLTPFFILAGTTVLVLALRLRPAALPVLMGVLIAAWISFMAVAFLIGHFQNVAGYVGTLAESLAANLTGRLSGSPEHRVVVYARLGFTGLVWVLAVIGVSRRLSAGRWDVTAVALAFAPFPLFAVQAYGGEMLLRIALFSLPFMALLAAFAFLPRGGERPGAATVAAIGVAAVVLMAGFMLTRYGNERLETFSRDEVAAVDELYRIAPPGSMLVGISGNMPWKATRYDEYRYRPIGDETFYGKADELLVTMAEHPAASYLIITRAQEALSEMILGVSAADWVDFERQLLESDLLEVIYRNPDAVIARYLPGGTSP